MARKRNRIRATIACLVIPAALSGCETIGGAGSLLQGVGRDLRNGSAWMQSKIHAGFDPDEQRAYSDPASDRAFAEGIAR